MDNSKLLGERTGRIKAAIALEKVDRVPVVPMSDAFCAKVMGIPLAQFATGEISNQTMIEAWMKLGEIDGHQRINFNVYTLSLMWLSKLKVPGIDLPADGLWQVAEGEIMKREDYDTIIDKGFNSFLSGYYKDRLDNVTAKVQHTIATMPKAIKDWENAVSSPCVPEQWSFRLNTFAAVAP